MRLRSVLGVSVALTLVATGASACKSSGGGTTNNPTTGTSQSGGGANAGKTFTISTDLPLQGSNKDTSDSTNQLIQLYLDTVAKGKAGSYNVKLVPYDDSTAAAGGWDDATCTKNANQHVNTANEIAVMGTYNSGCAKLEVPILNQATNPMLMVSNANTNPGLTKAWNPGEPDKYYPSGKRNYARVITTDDYQGTASAAFAKGDLKVKRCYVLNDNSTYGQGVARAFASSAQKQGITVLGNDAWDPKAPDYTDLFQKVKSKNPDCIYLGGTFDQNGGQIVKDKVAVLGNNTAIKLFAPDGFTGFPDLDKLPQAQGMYMSFAGLSSDQLIKTGGVSGTLLQAFKTKYGHLPVGNYPLYGVAAVQVILAALAKSDGTRAGVLNAVFSGSGISIPQSESVLGKEITIDPKTGDVGQHDISILLMKGNVETYLKPQSV